VVHEYACAMQQPLYVENWLRRLHVQDPNVHGLTTRARRLVFFFADISLRTPSCVVVALRVVLYGFWYV